MANDARILGESYNGRFQRRLGELFVEVVHEILPSVAGLLQEKAGLLSRGELTADACAALSERADAAGVLEQLSEFDAKLVDVQWRARKAAGIDIVIDKQTHVTVTGVDRQLVGQVAANIRGMRKPDPYKQKGVRYTGEVLKKKVGKTGAK
jgi:hypothetical protein